MKACHSKNLHVPLSPGLYAQLRKQSLQTKVPATRLARTAIEVWIKQQEKIALTVKISSYASEQAGSQFDLDKVLEKAGVEQLLHSTGSQKK